MANNFNAPGTQVGNNGPTPVNPQQVASLSAAGGNAGVSLEFLLTNLL
jgi:hypothetical protein